MTTITPKQLALEVKEKVIKTGKTGFDYKMQKKELIDCIVSHYLQLGHNPIDEMMNDVKIFAGSNAEFAFTSKFKSFDDKKFREFFNTLPMYLLFAFIGYLKMDR